MAGTCEQGGNNGKRRGKGEQKNDKNVQRSPSTKTEIFHT